MTDYITEHKKHLDQLKYLTPILIGATLLMIYFQDRIDFRWLVISILIGVMLFVVEYVWLRYVMRRYVSQKWFDTDIMLAFVIVPLSIKRGLVYVFIALSAFISLKMIFKQKFLQVLDELDKKYSINTPKR